MAYEDFEQDEAQPMTDQALESIRASLADLEAQIEALVTLNERQNEEMLNDVSQSRREMAYTRTALQRLQARFDSQLTVMVLSNIASGVGVAALMLAASSSIQSAIR